MHLAEIDEVNEGIELLRLNILKTRNKIINNTPESTIDFTIKRLFKPTCNIRTGCCHGPMVLRMAWKYVEQALKITLWALTE